MHWIKKWQPTPLFLPGESQRRQSLVGCHLWSLAESDTTEASCEVVLDKGICISGGEQKVTYFAGIL